MRASEPSETYEGEVSKMCANGTHLRTHGSRTAIALFLLFLQFRLECTILLDLCLVIPELPDVRKVRVVDAARHVLAREDGTIKLVDGRVELSARVDQVGQGLENDEVGADVCGDLFICTAVGDEFVLGWHVDAVHVGVPGDASLAY